MADAETHTLYATAAIGRDAEEFVQTDLGQTLIGMAQQHVHEAVESLKKAKPDDVEAIRSAQNEIWKAESFEAWLNELVIAGKQALAQLEERENE